MRCEEVHSLIKSYHNETLDEFTRIKIHHHLVDCQDCTEEYEMWLRGEEYIKLPSFNTWSDTTLKPSSGLLENVMSRIEEEEKWASPSVKKSIPLASRLKLFATFLVALVLVTSMLAYFTSLAGDEQTSPEHVIRLDMIGDSWKIDEVVMNDKGATEQSTLSETSMDFQVVASLSDPIIYTLSEENKSPPYIFIFTIFFSLMVILGLSWITRT